MNIRAIAVAVAVSTLAACSSSSKPAHNVAATSTTSTTTPAAPDTAADERLASNIVLQAGDLPSEWAPQTHQKDPTDAQGNAQLATCLGIPNSQLDRTADVDSDDYTMGALTISSNAGVLPTSAPVERDMVAYAGAKAEACFGSVVRTLFASLAPSGQLTKVDISMSPGPAPGRPDQRAQVTAHFAFTANGTAAELWEVAVYLAHGRIEAEVDVMNEGPTPVDAATIELAAGRVATRLAAAPA